MPIYAYKCSACGFAKDVLQKMSDAPLTDCPACGASAFSKQLTAAGFQLKGSGWYVTDFRDGGRQEGRQRQRPQARATPPAGRADACCRRRRRAAPAPAAAPAPPQRPPAKSD